MAEAYVGQSVHFVDGGAFFGRHLAATIVYIAPDTEGNIANLNVHNPGTLWPVDEPIFAQHGIGRDEARHSPGSWHAIEDQPFAVAVEISATTTNHISAMPLVNNA